MFFSNPQLYRLTYKTRFSREARKDIEYLYNPERAPILAATPDDFESDPAATIVERDNSKTGNNGAMELEPQSYDDNKTDPATPENIHHGNSRLKEQDNLVHDDDKKTETAPSYCWRFIYWFCGIPDSSDRSELSEDEFTDREKRQMDKIIEKPSIKYLLLGVLGFILCGYAFLYIYFA